MARKKWEAKTEITPELLSSREKRKWQINLRRYVIEKSPCPNYAPYFGLDIASIRKWFEYQFTSDLNWDNFASSWQFGHVLPLTYFDHTRKEELKLCWNFVNLRVEPLISSKKGTNRADLLSAGSYFEELYLKTGYALAKALKNKIALIKAAESENIAPQQQFLLERKEYLSHIEHYSAFEFDLLNHGKSIEEVEKEITLLTKNNRS